MLATFIDKVFEIDTEKFIDFNFGLGDSNDTNAEYFEAKIDSQKYKVQKDLSNPQEAANIIGILNTNVLKFLDFLVKKYPEDDRVRKMKKRYRPQNVMEGSPFNKENSTSYSLSKGEKIVFCIRSGKDPNQFHNTNLLMFVVIHELAHLASSSYGHNGEFRDNFKFLLQEAMDNGFYNRIDFDKNNKEYCGMQITTTPI
jgi:predicted metal-dependent hydrolase